MIGLLNVFAESGNFDNGLLGVFAINERGSTLAQVIRHAGDSMRQLDFLDKRGRIPTKKPDDRRDVEHTLVIGYENNWAVSRQVLVISKFNAAASQIPAIRNAGVHPVYRFFVGGPTKLIKRNNLHNVVNTQHQAKVKQVNNAQYVINYFFHIKEVAAILPQN